MARSDLQVEEIFHTEERIHKRHLELPLSGRVFVLIGTVVVFLNLLVVGRIGYLAFARGELYHRRATSNIHSEIVIPAPRGVVTDRFGTVLVRNKNAFSVWLDLPKLLKNPGQLEETLEVIAPLVNVPVEAIIKQVFETSIEREPVIRIARDISINSAIELKDRKMSGVQIVDDYTRDYIDGAVFAHIIGYGDQAGLEGQYNELLRGKNGRRVVYRDARGETLSEKQLASPESGQVLKTTIDADLQKYFYSRLGQGLRDLGRTSGVGIALNPQNGEVLALVSLPSFDNNHLADYLNKPNQPFFNRAISGEYNPGSAIKPLHALAALREKIVTPTTRYFSSGRLEVPNPYNPDQPSVFLDWAAHGWVDVFSALARSSNVYFYHIGGGYNTPELKTKGLGIERLNDYWRLFRLGAPTHVDLPFEATGFLPNPDEKELRTNIPWRLGDTYNVAIGQGDLLLTPLQLINFIASIGNNGKLFTPRLVLEDTASQPIFDYSDWTAELQAVKQGLADTVTKPYGTARLIGESGLSAAGKTGSAQVANNTRTNAFFVGYAPAGLSGPDPEIAVLVLVENALEGSLNAVPIARDVLEWYYENRINSL
jgi:penicillin-binding protein 2